MSWQTCPWCNIRINGDYKANTHYYHEHQAEYQHRQAEKDVRNSDARLAKAKNRLAHYDAVAAELAGVLPPIARSLMEKALNVYRYGEPPGLTDREILLENIASEEQVRRKYVARLEATIALA